MKKNSKEIEELLISKGADSTFGGYTWSNKQSDSYMEEDESWW